MREAVLLVSVLSPLFLITAKVWVYFQGMAGLPAFLWAAGICLFFGTAALVIQEMCFRREAELAGTLSTVLFRTLGPMLSAVILTHWKPELLRHQIFPAFVGCYLLTLTAETILSVCLIERWERLRTSKAPIWADRSESSCDNND